MITVSILLTCHNRKEKTLMSLRTLFESIDYYQANCDDNISFTVYLTDDGCSDGTSSAVLQSFADRNIVIIPSDGNAYWAGGMRIAWKKALSVDNGYDFFILINDDVVFKKECISELFKTHLFSLENYGKGGVYTGFVSENGDENAILYGAKKYQKKLMSAFVNLIPTGTPQECEMVNANILMVAANVVDKIGILDEAFIHAAADMDYGIRAKRAGFPVLTTSVVCGYSEFDHDNSDDEYQKVKSMSFSERMAFINKPTVKQYHDGLVFYWRYEKIKSILLGLSYLLNLFLPSIYYRMYKKRGH